MRRLVPEQRDQRKRNSATRYPSRVHCGFIKPRSTFDPASIKLRSTTNQASVNHRSSFCSVIISFQKRNRPLKTEENGLSAKPHNGLATRLCGIFEIANAYQLGALIAAACPRARTSCWRALLRLANCAKNSRHRPCGRPQKTMKRTGITR